MARKTVGEKPPSGGGSPLRVRMGELERDLVDLRLKLAMGRLENHGRIGEVRQEYARLATRARAEEIAAGEARGTRGGGIRIAAVPRADTAKVEPPEPKGGFMKGIVDKLSGSKE